MPSQPNVSSGETLFVAKLCAGVFVPSIPSQRMWENIFRTRRIKPLHHELSTDLLLRECVLWIHLNLEHSRREHEKDTCTDFPPKDAALSEKKIEYVRYLSCSIHSPEKTREILNNNFAGRKVGEEGQPSGDDSCIVPGVA